MSNVIEESSANPFISSIDRYDLLAKLSGMQATAMASSIEQLINVQIGSRSFDTRQNSSVESHVGSNTGETASKPPHHKDLKEKEKELPKDNKEDKEAKEWKDNQDHKDTKDNADKDSKDNKDAHDPPPKGKEEKEGKDDKEGKEGKESKDDKEDSDNGSNVFRDSTEITMHRMQTLVQLQTTRLNVLLKQWGAII